MDYLLWIGAWLMCQKKKKLNDIFGVKDLTLFEVFILCSFSVYNLSINVQVFRKSFIKVQYSG